jgi:hypothetical protein
LMCSEDPQGLWQDYKSPQKCKLVFVSYIW